MGRNKMKRKRRDLCPSPLLDEPPKRTKVHAQRKFAQGSNLNSPVITPVKEYERPDRSSLDLTPEPVELLPIRRPNTEDFLTFLCFRGTPLLPPNLNFFNTASIVDTNGQVHEIKSESPKNGPIDTSVISKCGSGPSDRPFIAFGVRKRADPIVISKQMEKKRRHALALQALRRKYQEQKMAKIRAVTISKLSEKPTNRVTARLNSVPKPEKTQQAICTKPHIVKNKIKIMAPKRINVTKQAVRTLTSKIKPPMCLRSFRGRFVQQELPFRGVKKKNKLTGKRVIEKKVKRYDVKKNLEKSTPKNHVEKKESNPVVVQKEDSLNVQDRNARVTRSKNHPLKNKIHSKRIMKRRLLMSSSSVKSRVLRSQTMKINTKKSRLTRKCLDRSGPSVILEKLPKRMCSKVKAKENVKETSISKNVPKTPSVVKNSSLSKNQSDCSKKANKTVKISYLKVGNVSKPNTPISCATVRTSDRVLRNNNSSHSANVSENRVGKLSKMRKNSPYLVKRVSNRIVDKTKIESKINKKGPEKTKSATTEVNNELDKRTVLRKSTKINNAQKVRENIKPLHVEVQEHSDTKEQKSSQRPSRKTKEAATIYMEILSHKLVNEKKTDDDNISIDSFPELPNAKRTEQREIELKAKANISKTDKVIDEEESQIKEEISDKMSITKESIFVEVNYKENDVNSQLISEPYKKMTKLLSDTEQSVKSEVLENFENSILITKIYTKKDKDEQKEVTQKINSHKMNMLKSDTQKKTNVGEPQELSLDKLNVQNKPKESQRKVSERSNIKIKDELKNEQLEALKFSNNLDDIPIDMLKKELIKGTEKENSEHQNSEQNIKITPPTIETVEKLSTKEKIQTNQQKIIPGKNPRKLVPIEITNTPNERFKTTRHGVCSQIEEDVKLKSVSQRTPKNSSDSDECLANLPRKSKSVSETKQPHREKCTQSSNKVLTKTEIKTSCKEKDKISSDSDNECLANISKTLESKFRNVPCTRRKTRNNSQKRVPVESDSEDSFNLNVKVTRKKLSTRSRSSKVSAIRTKSVRCSDSTNIDSDESTTSSKHALIDNKNISENNSEKKIESKAKISYSDSDEEPLSKFTVFKKTEEKSAKQLKEDILRKQKALIESSPQKNKGRKNVKHKESKEIEEKVVSKIHEKEEPTCVSKPKRECAKIPSNYLPMFSSSDDEEKFFHGFSMKTENKNESIYSHSSLDFLSKDLRRFGKEKVNMSNEQIHKWLKDSAMAEGDIKKDVGFCQEIMTEASPNSSTTIDTEKVKNSSVVIDDEAVTPEKKNSTSEENILKSPKYKSPSDRKPIFKKEKIKIPPTVGAFSVNNESSIYAFEEDIEDMVNTPFRRPSRRPSSTATSRSEDEFSKSEEQSKGCQFRKPVLRNEAKAEEQKLKTKDTDNFVKKTQPTSQKLAAKVSSTRNVSGKSMKKCNSDHLDDVKYKVPSSPSASSSSSAKLYKKQSKHKPKTFEICNPVKMTDFPCNGPGELVEAPTFYPTEKEFQDPLEYIEKIGARAEQFGICRIVPPSTFKPECKVSDDMRFTSYNQYVHKMLHRWGPNFKELMAIKKYLQTQNINLTQPPWIGGMEIDLPRLYQTVQNLGGLKEVIEKEKWSKVSDIMRIPKSAQDRVTKLDDIYCKYLLPYDTLSPDEREKLLDEVETSWATRESKTILKLQKSENSEVENGSDSESDHEIEECITKGRNMALNTFYRIARNTMSMWFKNSEPSVSDIEQEFWKHVVQRQNHICVHSGSIDSGSWGYGFAVSKNSPFARHAWNLKVLTNNSGSVLRSLGPVMGVTVPTLHVGMVFSGCCWYRDPHSLPWIEYLHTGGSKIWYGIPNSVGDLFQKALTKLVPNYCRTQSIWLQSDTVMLPPSLLIESGVSLSRTVQEPGQFMVVFPKAFTSSVSTGYVVSESVFFAPPSWLKSAQMTFNLLRDSCEPSMFSLDRLYLCIVNDQRTSVDVLKQMIPIVSAIYSREKCKREKLHALGVKNLEFLPPPEAPNPRKKRKSHEGGEYECDTCRMNLFISMIVENQDNAVYCLDHAIEQIEKNIILPENCKLLYTYTEEDLEGLVSKINSTIEQKKHKKVFNKFSGMPTLLNKQI